MLSNFETKVFKNIKDIKLYKTDIQKYNISQDELEKLYFKSKDKYCDKIKGKHVLDSTFKFNYDSYDFEMDELEEKEKKEREEKRKIREDISIKMKTDNDETKLKEYLNWSKSERSSFDKTSAGIPIDSTNNQLGDWVWFARLSNPDYQAVIKGDRETNFPVVKRVFDIFQEKKVNKFNFVTNLEKRPTV